MGLEKDLYIGFRGPHGHLLRKTEAQIRSFLQPDPSAFTSSALNLAPMRAPVRYLVHLMAPWYGLISESIDPEPRRSVRLLKTQASPGEGDELPELLSTMDMAIDVDDEEDEDEERGERVERDEVGKTGSSSSSSLIDIALSRHQQEEGWMKIVGKSTTVASSSSPKQEGKVIPKPREEEGQVNRFAPLPSSVNEVVDDWTQLLESSDEEEE